MSKTVSRKTRAALAAVTLVATLVACSDSSDQADSPTTTSPTTSPTDTSPTDTSPTDTSPTTVEPEEVPSSASFEEFIDFELPSGGSHGDLLRYQVVPPDDTWAADAGTRYRILYRSVTPLEEPTFVTGLVSVPPGTAPDGGWRLASHAHGSTGLADDCAPSSLPDDLSVAETLLVQGQGRDHDTAVVSTDYEGQGGPGRHPYLAGVSEGRSVLDAALAARQIPDVDITTDQVGLLGYSQGGHAILWANEIAEDYAPELDVVGTVSGAPASELVELADAAGGLGSVGLVMLFAGLSETDADADLADLLTDDGLAVLDVVDRSCSAQPDASLLDGDLLRVDPRTTEPWAGLLDANTPGSHAGAGPVLIFHGTDDEQVPPEHSEALLARMCAAGATVERRLEPDLDHVEGAIPTYVDGFVWLEGLMAGEEPTDGC